MQKALIILLILLSLSIVGCASRGEIETMKTQLAFLERSSTQMQNRLVEMDSLYRETIDKNVTYQADLKTALADLIDKSSAIDGRMGDMEAQINRILDRLGSPTRPVPPPVSPGDTSSGNAADSTLPQIDPNKLFNNAFTDLKAGNYDLAIMQFNEFLNLFKDSPRADDAQYWLGECYYGKKEYAKAAPEFEKVEKNYPEGDKLVAAIYKLGRSYEEIGDVKKARAIFERIVKDYPTSFEAQPAQDRLRGLQ